jgi:hypothetical protein
MVNEIASSVFYYPRWKDGLFCNAAENLFRQHPLDYIEGLEATIKDCLQKAGSNRCIKCKSHFYRHNRFNSCCRGQTWNTTGIAAGF